MILAERHPGVAMEMSNQRNSFRALIRLEVLIGTGIDATHIRLLSNNSGLLIVKVLEGLSKLLLIVHQNKRVLKRFRPDLVEDLTISGELLGDRWMLSSSCLLNARCHLHVFAVKDLKLLLLLFI